MRQHAMAIGVMALAVVVMSGCGIPKEQYAKSQKELADSRARGQEKDQMITDLNGKVEGCEKKSKECDANFATCTENLQVCMASSSKTETELKSLGEEYADTRTQLASLKKANELRQKALDELFAKFHDLIKGGKLTIGINDGRMVIQLSSNVLFDVGKSNLSKEGRAAVEEVAGVLKTIDGRKFQVAGHTDNQRGKGKINPNWTLSYNRARSVFDVLVETGVDETRLSIAAYAEYSPVVANDTPEGQDANRRIEIVLLPTSDELPLKQLKKIEEIKQ